MTSVCAFHISVHVLSKAPDYYVRYRMCTLFNFFLNAASCSCFSCYHHKQAPKCLYDATGNLDSDDVRNAAEAAADVRGGRVAPARDAVHLRTMGIKVYNDGKLLCVNAHILAV